MNNTVIYLKSGLANLYFDVSSATVSVEGASDKGAREKIQTILRRSSGIGSGWRLWVRDDSTDSHLCYDIINMAFGQEQVKRYLIGLAR